METASPLLENPLLIAAILLFLAILPRALKQRQKTDLDKAVEQFEKEELQAASENKSLENTNQQQKPIALKDGSLAYPKDNPSSYQQAEDEGGIPPFPTQEEEKVKIVKPGIPISHYETLEPPPRKKVKLIKNSFSIAPDKSKTASKKVLDEPIKDKSNPLPVVDNKPIIDEDLPVPPAIDHDEPSDNWIEAEIPGLSLELPPEEKEEKSEDIPVFNAFPKKMDSSTAGEQEVPLSKEKQESSIKNNTPKTEEIKNSKPKKQASIEPDTLEKEIEFSKSEPKEVEIKAPVVSHRNIDKTDTETLSSKPETTGDEKKETAKLKPFFLDLKYLDTEGQETKKSVSEDALPVDKVEMTIARLTSLQDDLENQLRKVSNKVATKIRLGEKGARMNRSQDLPPSLESMHDHPSDKKEVSLEELDSFLFTATQKQKKE